MVNRGKADRLFINTAGIGLVEEGRDISGANARPGDKIILSGGIGEHGIAVMSQREGLKFNVPVASDCAPLNRLVAAMLEAGRNIHSLRDPTRGGLASTLSEFALQSGTGSSLRRIKSRYMTASGRLRAAGTGPALYRNEGKLVAGVAPEEAGTVLAAMRKNKYASKAAIIGEFTSSIRPRDYENPYRVITYR